MRILGIETSCDETAVAIVENGTKVLSNIVSSQIDIHKEFGGVVPEVAARSHIEAMTPVAREALRQADSSWDDIDAIAVTYGPGLIGSLLIGTLTARILAMTKDKPLYPIHHVKSHVYASYLNQRAPEFPLLSLIVSGGHTQIVLFHSHESYEILGRTQDDAVGEAFDKVAKIIGLPYPGGPSISEAAKKGNSSAYTLPKARLQGAYDFSFSGLKTAVLRRVQSECGVDFNYPSHKLSELLTEQQKKDFAASFQKTAVETLVDKLEKACQAYSPASIVVAGGVAANNELRRIASDRLKQDVTYPDFQYCTDNAAMVASLAYFEAQHHKPANPRELAVMASVSM